MRIQLKRSSALEGSQAKPPSAAQLEYGELAVNFNESDPAIFFKDSNNKIIRMAGDGAIGSGNAEIELVGGPGLYIREPVFNLDQYDDQTITIELILETDAEIVGLETVAGKLRAKSATSNEKGVLFEPDGGVGIYMRQDNGDGTFTWVNKDASISLPNGYPDLSDGKGANLDDRYINRKVDDTFTGSRLTIQQNLTVGNDLDANKINASGTITGNVTGDLTGNADTATFAQDAQDSQTAVNSTNCNRSVLGGAGLTGGGKLNTNRTLNVGASDATIIVDPDGIRVDQNQLNFTPAANDGQININASNGLEATGSNATANQSGTTTRVISGINATTSAKGVVQLDNSNTSTSTTKAATANAARKAYNRAEEYAPAKDGTNATGTWDIDISGNAATATLAENVSGTVANADLAAEANLVKVNQSTGNNNRPFVFIANTSNASGSYEQLLRDSAATCFINPSANKIGASSFVATNIIESPDLKATTKVSSPKFTSDGNVTLQPGGATGKTLYIYPGQDDGDSIGGPIYIGKGTTDGGGGHIYFRGNGGPDQFRFAKSGQTSIEGFLDFESLTGDRTFTYPDVTGTLALKNGGTFNKIVFENDEKSDLTEDGELRFDGSQGLILYRSQQGMGSTPGAVTVLDGANVEAGDGLTISNLLAGSTTTGRITFAVDSTVARQSGGAVTLATTANKVKLTANTSNTWREFLWSNTEGAGGSSKSIYVNGSGTTKAAINSSTGNIQSPQFNIVNGGKLGPCTGDYGNIQVDTSNTQGGYAGFSIQGAAVFMRKGTTFGLYDDTNNHWALRHIANAQTELYYDGSIKIKTTSIGAEVTGDVVAGAAVACGEYRKLELNCNDGQGNANICFNHANGVAQRTGSSARILSDVDSATGKIEFQVGNNSTANTSKTLSEIMGITTSGVTATKFIGPLEGNVTGNVSGSSGSTTGNAATATQLKTARTLWGVSFNGTANISGAMTGVNNITGANATMTIQPADSTTSRTLNLYGNNNTSGTGGNLVLGHKDRGSIYFRTGSTFRFAKKNQTSIEGILNFDNLTADRTFTFPNKTGTIALTGEPVDNADKLDGLDSTQFLRSDASDIYDGGQLDIKSNSVSGHYFGAGIKYTTKYVHTNADSWGYLVRNSGSGGMEIKVAKEAGTSGGNATFRDFKIGGSTASLTYDGKKVWYEGNDGSNSGLDADKLDGQHGSSFLRSNANDTLSAIITGHASNTEVFRVRSSTYSAKYLYIGGWSTSNSDNISRIRTSENLHIDSPKNGSLYLNWYASNKAIFLGNTGQTVYAAGNNKVWHAGNDGSGSGLDADKLDGVQASSFLRSDADDIKTGGYLRFNDNIHQYFGSGNDFDMFCNGSHMYMDLKSGIGNLYIRDGTTTRFTFDDNGTFTASSVVKGSQWQGGLRNSDVLNAIKSTGGYAVGSYLFATHNDSNSYGINENIEGSRLRPVNAAGSSQNSTPGGTWKAMGVAWGDSGNYTERQSSLFLRIA